MSKTICHFTCAHEAYDTRIFIKECISLVKAGYNVYLIAPNAKTEVKQGVNIIGVSIRKHNPLYRVFCASNIIYKKALELDADIYHFHDIELFLYGVKLKKKGKKVIFDSHEDWLGYIHEISWLSRFIKIMAGRYIERLYKKYMPIFDAVITVSPHIVDSLERYSSNIHMITNYPIVDKDLLRELDEREYILRDNRVCYAGTVYENSNQRETIKALDQIDNIEYLIVGLLDDNLKLELSTLTGWNKVKFVPRVSKRELIELYNTALAGLIIFDYSHNCGEQKGTMGNNKIFEYMLEGLPIICTDFECWKDYIVDKYNCGICVPPGDIDAIRNAIKFLIENKSMAYSMGVNARRAVIEEFNWTTQEEKIIEIYKNI